MVTMKKYDDLKLRYDIKIDDFEREISGLKHSRNVSFFINIVFLLIIWMLILNFSDNIDVDVLGVYMCEQHGYNYVDKDYRMQGSTLTDLVITCEKSYNETYIDDGYLKVLK